MIYLDTSALIKLYLFEEGSNKVQSLVESQDDPLPVWELQQSELHNALRLKVFWGDLCPEQADEQLAHFSRRKDQGQYVTPQIDRIMLMRTFESLAHHTMELGCRTLDVLHVACALQVEPQQFVSFDGRQCQLALRAGLSIAD